ncbi:MAG: hypothetical protein WBM17_00900 [Anaerolineales bacterium]
MTRNLLRMFPAGIFLFLLAACNNATPVPTPAVTPGAVPSQTPTASPAETETPGVARVYAVILVPEGATLDARSDAGDGYPVAGTLAWDAAGLPSTGRVVVAGTGQWVELSLTGGGTGWVNRKLLTEYVTSADFCADGRAVTLFETLYEAARSNDGRILTPIVSPVHGLTVTYLHNGNPKVYDPGQAGMVFGSAEIADWGLGPGSGLPVRGTFEDLVRPNLLAVFGSAETHCNTIQLGGASYTVTWPSLWKNVNFYSVYKPGSPGMEMDWMTWLAGVEYVDGVPYLFSLSRYNWEP